MERQRFVARKRELEQLDTFLDLALAGQGQVCFVVGEAGSGKTALIAEFARRALEQHHDLVVAVGQSDAQTGAGDPYLPFREVLAQLTGDVETKLAQGTITEENVGRLRKLLRHSGQALAEVGPDLIGIFIPGAGLAARLAAFVAEKAGWLDKLERLAGRTRESITDAATGIGQSHILEQYTNVLKKVAEKHPLMLVLDDLQWADAASVDLLFRLGRRIGESHILIVATYRPAEVALGRAGERHPLDKVLAEFKRYFGDIHINLDQAKEVEGQHFCDAFLDTEPNRLGKGFRQAFYQHTGGHPLFTIELLRDMQERGDLILDEEGHWIEGPVLDWTALPARVEGVIEERIGRLEEGLREALTVASVEGEDFTAEVVARVQEMDVRGLVRRLSKDLDRQHRLIQAQGILRLGTQRLSLYRFQHNLFQKYLYSNLDQVERAYLHEDVGNVLEDLYGDQVDAIATAAIQLARHFAEAGIAEKAVHYLQRAGELAAVRYANDEAVTYFGRALALATEASERYTLLLARERVYDVQGARETQQQDLASLGKLAESLDDDGLRAEVALRRAHYAEMTGNYSETIAAAQEAIALARAADDVRNRAKGHLCWGRTLVHQGDYDAARTQLEQSLALTQAAPSGAQLRMVEAESLRSLGNVSWYQGDPVGARGYFEQAAHIYHEIGDRRGRAMVLVSLGSVSWREGNYAKARDYYERALAIHREIGNRRGEGEALGSLGINSALQGDYASAQGYFEQALSIFQDISDRRAEGLVRANLGRVFQDRGNHTAASAHYEQALCIAQEIGNRQSEGTVLGNLGVVSDRLGDYARARVYLEQALAICHKIGDLPGIGNGLADLGLLSYHQGDNESALKYLQQALLIAQESGDRSAQGIALTFQGHILVQLGYLDEAADAYRQALDLRRELGEQSMVMAPQAGLAQVSLARGDLDQAQDRVEEILSFLQGHSQKGNSLEGIAEPFQVYMTCYHVLQANNDPRAHAVLSTAHSLLQERAARIIDEELRRSFLENVAVHREIVKSSKRTALRRVNRAKCC